ncbi:PAS domain S-box protein [Clostridium sp.]|uniref:PAS domain S-box protein n=1 Tax=Clostridium sp. TaxID=1506 RepID=UPI00262540C6|nr:PAS domain S-box protein [Clostridium sp.]
MCEGKTKAVVLDKNAEIIEASYKEIWDKIEELIFVIELDENFAPKYFVDFNNKLCSNLGYTKEELVETLLSNIFNLDELDNQIKRYRDLTINKDDKIEMLVKSKEGKHIYIEAKISLFNKDEKDYLLAIATDITKHKKLEKEFAGVLNGIPDVIKVYNTDHSISFFNEAGYEFYNKVPEEVEGKMCYEILDRKEKCLDCSFGKVVASKQKISRERFIPELNKFMDVCYNPVLDETGELLFIVERLRDITEKKILDKILKDSKERYKQIITNSPDAVVIIVDNIIALANNEACNLFRISYNNLIGSNVYKHFDEKYTKALHKRFKNIIAEKRVKDVHDYEFYFSNKLINLQISYSYITYEGNSAILAVIRDITEMKEEINKAAELQRKTLQKDFPAKEFVDIVSTYVPAKTISGDFYRIFEVSKNVIIGIIVDVRGKGISAALQISAFDILCFQEIAKTNEPMEIVKNLNEKLINYYDENYIAVCCFSMNFNKNELKVVGAGINQFIFQRKDEDVEEIIVEGPFLGMFEDSEFCEQVIHFKQGDKIYFFTDGLDFIFDEDKIVKRYMKKVSILRFKEYIDVFLNDTILDVGKLKDDCTMIAMEIK